MKWKEKKRTEDRKVLSYPLLTFPFTLFLLLNKRAVCSLPIAARPPGSHSLNLILCQLFGKLSGIMIHDSLDWIESDIFNAWLSLSESVNQWISNVMYLLYNSPLLCWCWLTISQLVPLFGNCYIASVQWHSYIWVLYFAFRHLVRFLIAEAL